MPCRCDGYEITAGEVRAEMNQKVEHLEGQLCNARSLIHKLLKYIDGNLTNLAGLLPTDLRDRANAHVALLLQHKRQEHEQDTKRLKDQIALERAGLEHRRRSLEGNRKTLQGQQAALGKSEIEIQLLEQKLSSTANPTDEEILG